jgi:hypothetical protein
VLYHPVALGFGVERDQLIIVTVFFVEAGVRRMGDENVLWRECVRWMVDCGILDRQHTTNWPTAELFDFAQILRDGVLLCQVANRLAKGCIDTRELSLRPQLSQVGGGSLN